MNTLFLGIVIFLIVLAVFDLVVGVSNDAVNFLNSAIGAKVARYRTVVHRCQGGEVPDGGDGGGRRCVCRSGLEQRNDGRGATRHHDTGLLLVL